MAGTRWSSGSGRREAGGVEEEAERGPEAAAANAALGARPSSPHVSTGGRVGRERGRVERTQRGRGVESPPTALSVVSATAGEAARLPAASEP